MAGSEPVADAEEQDIGVAVVVRQDPAPREASGPVAPDPVARGHREDAPGEGIGAALALLVHGDVHAEAGAEREPVAEKARLVPTLRHDAVAPDEVRVALVEPRDRAPERGTEGVPVLDARGDRVVVLGAQAVDDGRAGEQRQLVALRRRARLRAAVDGLVILVQLVADAEDELRRVDAFLRLDVVEPHLVEPAPRAAPGRSRAVEHAVAVRVGVVAGALAGSYGSVVVAVGAGARREAEPRAERRGLGPELQRLAVAVGGGGVPLRPPQYPPAARRRGRRSPAPRRRGVSQRSLRRAARGRRPALPSSPWITWGCCQPSVALAAAAAPPEYRRRACRRRSTCRCWIRR